MLRRLAVPAGSESEVSLEGDDVDVVVASEARPAPPDRPWVVVSMIASADGATHVDGVSGPLGGAGDTAVFLALRSVADVVVAGSATVAAEQYRPPRASAERQRRRVARGQAPLPRLAVISNAGDIDLSLPLFADAGPEQRPIVLTAGAVDPSRRAALDEAADVIVAGDDRVDVRRAISLLGSMAGARTVLAEGGAILNGLLVEADLVDEWCLTVSPCLVGGGANRAAIGAAPERPRGLRLERVFEADGELMLRYVRARTD